MTSTGDAMTECPRCGYQQDGGEECLRCGVVFAKVRGPSLPNAGPDPTARRTAGRPHPSSAPRPAAGSRSDASALLTWLLVAVGSMAFWLWWSGGSEPEPLLETYEEARSAAAEAEPTPQSRTTPEPDPERRSGPPDRGAGTAPDRGLESGPEWRENAPEEPAPFRQPVVTFLWHEGALGYRRAIEEQADTHQPLLVYFYTDWCGYCRELERELLSAYEVEDYIRHLIKVKINPENGSREREISDGFGVRSYPSLFVKGQGRFFRIQRGIRDRSRVRLQTPTEFVVTLRRATGYEGG